MDKFGVLNLLGSLLNKTQQENSTNPTDFTTKTTENSKPVLPTSAPPLPLQAGMINTMTSHDEFIKRVQQKNKK